MTTICADEMRPTISTPFATIHDGKDYDCATNGHAMVVVEGSTFAPRCDAPDIWSVVPNRGVSDQTATTTFGELLEWCKPEEKPGDGECDTCHGTGEVECDMGHDHTCEDCDGTSEYQGAPGYPLHPGKLCGVVLNRRLLYSYLAPIPVSLKSFVTISNPDNLRARVDGEGWFVIVMSMRYDDNNIDEFPKKAKVA